MPLGQLGAAPLPGTASPVLADLGQIVGEDESGAAAVGAVHDKNIHGRQLDSRIVFGDASVVPLGDFAQVDVGQDVRPYAQVTDALQVENRHHSPEHGRNGLNLHLGGGQLLVRHGDVAGAKIDRARRNLADAATAADRLVVDLDPGMGGAVLTKPLGINRIGEGRSRSIELLRVPRADRCTHGNG